ncbi:porin [Sutterella megalosphaeroides]|uniref:Outer membrane porin protein n=1 Tax=Sutterella megalosphaeroides TaxID=2494234 RepID=A0A2Z6IDZ5_9BURK|nr:porin [Sutterella megalosphaeroides]BBF23398.1 outer membrane porin protein [Sutterella megalosphaeroides]
MKKTLAALAVLGAFAGSAAAADVTVYGVVDTGLAYTYENSELGVSDTGFTEGTNGSENQFGMQSGYNSSSRFGIKGTEDLGNGLKVGFKLENGFSSDDGTLGQSGRLFGRESSLSLMSEFGTISFGRMGGVASSAGTYDIVYSIADSFDGGDNDVLGLNISDRYDNMVTYQSPKFAGVQGTVQYSFKQDNKSDTDTGDEGTSKVNRYASFALTGDFGPLQMVGAYELTKYANTDNHDETHAFYLGGNYDFQVLKLFAMAQYTKAAKDFGTLEDPLSVIGNLAGTEKGIDSYGLHLGTIVPAFGGDFTAAVYYVDGETDTIADVLSADATYLGVSARYVYPLSKRTSIYAGAGYAEEKIDSNVGPVSATDKNKLGQAYAGITHTF